MPVYTYRREDGTTFDYRQKFVDDPLTVDPETGQHVTRVIQPAGVIFKGSGFYINDSKSASRSTISGAPKSEKGDKSDSPSAEKSEHSDKSEKSEKSEKKESAESKPAAASTESAPKAAATAAAD
jgi:predicted nucleic acid-binding Zn ribbon protein